MRLRELLAMDDQALKELRMMIGSILTDRDEICFIANYLAETEAKIDYQETGLELSCSQESCRNVLA